jgi:hypothetical protein
MSTAAEAVAANTWELYIPQTDKKNQHTKGGKNMSKNSNDGNARFML